MSTVSQPRDTPLKYVDYVETIAQNYCRYGPLSKWLKIQPSAKEKDNNAFIYIGDGAQGSLKFSKYMGHGDLDRSNLKNLRETIYKPDSDIEARLIVMDIRKQHLSPEVIDILGMVYNIEPSYFASVISKYIHPTLNREGPDQVVEMEQSSQSFLHLDLLGELPQHEGNYQHLWVKYIEHSNLNGKLVRTGKIIFRRPNNSP